MATVNLRESARAAWEAKEADRIGTARAGLGAVIGTANAADGAMDVVEVRDTADGSLVVFADAAGVNVAVNLRDGGSEVHLVRADGDRWAWLGEAVRDLPHLWELIDAHLPEQAAAPAWSTQVAYAVGDRVTYQGETYEAIQAHTSQATWEPPNVPALWVKVA